jgi:hypothetical protein
LRPTGHDLEHRNSPGPEKGKRRNNVWTDEFGTKHLHSKEFRETVSLKVEVMPQDDGGSARVMFSDQNGFRYGFNLCAEAADELIEALNPILASKGANWEHVWVRTPNPKHRPDE